MFKSNMKLNEAMLLKTQFFVACGRGRRATSLSVLLPMLTSFFLHLLLSHNHKPVSEKKKTSREDKKIKFWYVLLSEELGCVAVCCRVIAVVNSCSLCTSVEWYCSRSGTRTCFVLSTCCTWLDKTVASVLLFYFFFFYHKLMNCFELTFSRV